MLRYLLSFLRVMGYVTRFCTRRHQFDRRRLTPATEIVYSPSSDRAFDVSTCLFTALTPTSASLPISSSAYSSGPTSRAPTSACLSSPSASSAYSSGPTSHAPTSACLSSSSPLSAAAASFQCLPPTPPGISEVGERQDRPSWSNLLIPHLGSVKFQRRRARHPPHYTRALPARHARRRWEWLVLASPIIIFRAHLLRDHL